MINTRHCNKRLSERNINNLSTSIIYLFGNKLDKRDGLQIDIVTYRELQKIGLDALTNSRKLKEAMHGKHN